jgi:membrane associated rhomboid family serine protease
MAEIETRVEIAIPSPRKLFTPAVTVILILMVIGYALTNYAKSFMADYLALSIAGVFSGKIWQLATYPFVECSGLMLIFNIFLVLFVGSNVEREWRTVGIISLWLIISMICGIIWVLVCRLIDMNYLGSGASACGFGLIAVFGLLYRRKRFLAWFWALEAQHVSWGLIVIGSILSIPQPITWIWLTGAPAAYLYYKLRLRARPAGTAPTVQTRPPGFVDID